MTVLPWYLARHKYKILSTFLTFVAFVTGFPSDPAPDFAAAGLFALFPAVFFAPFLAPFLAIITYETNLIRFARRIRRPGIRKRLEIPGNNRASLSVPAEAVTVKR